MVRVYKFKICQIIYKKNYKVKTMRKQKTREVKIKMGSQIMKDYETWESRSGVEKSRKNEYKLIWKQKIGTCGVTLHKHIDGDTNPTFIAFSFANC